MNKFKLYLDNFQSISSGELEFTTGQNFIIGQSNSGKTATFRAIKACLLNPKGSQRFIKKGHKSSNVTIEYNGNTISWKRTPKESSYTINGEDYIKTGSSNAFKILDGNTGFATGLGNSSIMNIEGEFDVPFPFDLSSTDLFKLFENIFCISDSAVILKSAKEHEDKTKKEIEVIEADILKNDRKLKALEEFKNEVDIERLINYKEFLTSNCGKLELLKKDLPFIKKVKVLDDSNIAISLYEIKGGLTDSYANLINLKALSVRIGELHKIGKELPKSFTLNPNIVNIYNDLKLLRKLFSIPVDFCIYENLEDKTERLKELKVLQSLAERLKKLHNMKITTKINEDELKGKLARYNDLISLKGYFKTLSIRIREQKESLKKVEDAIERYKKELVKFDVCPLCHQPLKNCQENKNVIE